jgi:hypothetical protein
MEIREHVPWIAGMLVTAAAFIGTRYRDEIPRNRRLRTIVTAMLAVSFALVAAVGVLGVLINKVAPLE